MPTKPIHVSNDDYEVGYCKPPEHTKFKKGQSGNPYGRRNIMGPPVWEDPIKVLLREKISITVKGKHIKIPTYVALLRMLRQKALQGDMKSTQMLLTLSDGLRSLIDEEERKANSADLAYIEAVYQAAKTWELKSAVGKPIVEVAR